MRLRRRLRLWDTLASEEWKNIIDVIVSATLNEMQIFLNVCITLAGMVSFCHLLEHSRCMRSYFLKPQ